MTSDSGEEMSDEANIIIAAIGAVASVGVGWVIRLFVDGWWWLLRSAPGPPDPAHTSTPISHPSLSVACTGEENSTDVTDVGEKVAVVVAVAVVGFSVYVSVVVKEGEVGYAIAIEKVSEGVSKGLYCCGGGGCGSCWACGRTWCSGGGGGALCSPATAFFCFANGLLLLLLWCLFPRGGGVQRSTSLARNTSDFQASFLPPCSLSLGFHLLAKDALVSRSRCADVQVTFFIAVTDVFCGAILGCH